MHGGGGGGNGLPHHGHPSYDDNVCDSEMVMGRVKKSRRRSSHLDLNSNAMYSKAIRHSTISSSNGGHSHHVDDDEAVYNTRLDAAIGAQKF